MKTYTPDENGYINITITNDEPIFSGDFTLLGYAVDNVGNENSLSYGTTEFALASQYGLKQKKSESVHIKNPRPQLSRKKENCHEKNG